MNRFLNIVNIIALSAMLVSCSIEKISIKERVYRKGYTVIHWDRNHKTPTQTFAEKPEKAGSNVIETKTENEIIIDDAVCEGESFNNDKCISEQPYVSEQHANTAKTKLKEGNEELQPVEASPIRANIKHEVEKEVRVTSDDDDSVLRMAKKAFIMFFIPFFFVPSYILAKIAFNHADNSKNPDLVRKYTRFIIYISEIVFVIAAFIIIIFLMTFLRG